MKTLYLIRHAKSSWKDLNAPDHKRKLNERGKRDAPFMGELLHKKGVQPDIIVSSYAVRALTTAKIIAKAVGYAESDIDVRQEVYLASFQTLMNIVRHLNNKANIAFLFGHNPDFTAFANTFSDEYIPNVPTCGIVEIRFDVQQWSDITSDNGQVISFEFPKKYFSGEQLDKKRSTHYSTFTF